MSADAAAPSGAADGSVGVLVPIDGAYAVLPGEPVLLVGRGAAAAIGPGLRVASAASDPALMALFPEARDEGCLLVVATLPGVVRATAITGPTAATAVGSAVATTRYTVQVPTARRYAPSNGDSVVGRVARTTVAAYIVDIGAPHPALLPVIAFDGATKQNKPRLAPGDTVYCQVLSAPAGGLDVELSCAAPAGVVAKDWVTGEGLYGPLSGGTTVAVPLQYAAELFSNEAPVVSYLGERGVPFECCIGLNGRVWVKAVGATEGDAVTNTIAVARCIADATDDRTIAAVTARIDAYFPSTHGGAAAAPV